MKKILLSLALIGLTLASATSATRAFFTDQKVLGDNTFSSGNISIDVLKNPTEVYSYDSAVWSQSGIYPGWNDGVGETQVFTPFILKNTGSLPLKYKVSLLDQTDANVSANTDLLSELRFYVKFDGVVVDSDATFADAQSLLASHALNSHLAAGSSESLAEIAPYLPTTAVSGENGTVKFDIQVDSRQLDAADF